MRGWMGLFFLLVLAMAGEVRAQVLAGGNRPAEYQGVGIQEKLDARLPLEVVFTNERGKAVRLGDYFQSGRPVLLQLGYYQCPTLCGLVSQALVDSLRQSDLQVGKDFDVLMVSIDPTETHTLAALKKQSYIQELGSPEAAPSWHLLTGNRGAIKAICAAAGFEYKWIDSVQQYSHPAAIVVLMPDGRVSRYLHGVKYDPKTLRLSVVEASQGMSGSTMDQFLLVCFKYDQHSGRYTLAAVKLMRFGGALTVIVVGGILGRLYYKEYRARKKRVEESATGPAPLASR